MTRDEQSLKILNGVLAQLHAVTWQVSASSIGMTKRNEASAMRVSALMTRAMAEVAGMMARIDPSDPDIPELLEAISECAATAESLDMRAIAREVESEGCAT